jgi:hypothetical protein
MSIVEPAYRRPLNSDQLMVLEILRAYRFCTAEHFSQYFNKPSGKYVQKRLRILEAQGYIAKHYEPSYKLRGKPASYYLLPSGARALKASDSTRVDERMMKSLYKNKNMSDTFIDHCLLVVSIRNKFRTLYGDKLYYYAQTSLKDWERAPSWTPDAYMELKSGAKCTGKRRSFFLDVFDANTPFFVMARKVDHYLKYKENSDWNAENESDLPTFLMICPDTQTQTKLRRRITKALDEIYEEDMRFAVTTSDQLLASTEVTGKVWQLTEEPEMIRSLNLLA